MAMVFCRGCGKEIHETAVACPHCGAPGAAPANTSGSASDSGSSGLKYIVPIGRSIWAVAAGYLAFFAIFAFPAPLALFCGIMGLLDIKKNPKKLGKPRAIFGIVMGLVGCALLIVIYTRK